MYAEVLVTSFDAGVGLVFNLTFFFTLAHSWKQWRQVKYYLVFLTVGNMFDIIFTLGVHIVWLLLTSWDGSDLYCKLTMFARGLGPFLTSMAVAALAVHVLLTSVTGNQGSRLRHTFLIGLFVALSLPVPILQIPMIEMTQTGLGERILCDNSAFFSSEEQKASINIVFFAILTFLPLGVIVATLAASFTINRFRRGLSCKGDTHPTDLILTGLLGFVLALCCVPHDVLVLYSLVHPDRMTNELRTVNWDLLLLVFTKPAINALVCVVFWFCFRKVVRNEADKECFPLTGESCETGQTGETEVPTGGVVVWE